MDVEERTIKELCRLYVTESIDDSEYAIQIHGLRKEYRSPGWLNKGSRIALAGDWFGVKAGTMQDSDSTMLQMTEHVPHANPEHHDRQPSLQENAFVFLGQIALAKLLRSSAYLDKQRLLVVRLLHF